jgi:hypothetical protein
MFAYELIFSFGEVNSYGSTPNNIVRFTAFLNMQSQKHYNFSNHIGMYTGIGVRNVGFINRFPVPGEAEATVKQRAYSIGVPLALKLGGLENGNYLALGAEAEFMFHYKEKILQGSLSWFSTDVTQFNPSVFADLRFHNGTFFRVRYYLENFLSNHDMNFVLPESGTTMAYKPEKSTLWYISIGSAFKTKYKHKLTKNEV